MDELIMINKLELASELAHNAAKDELGIDEEQMWEVDVMGGDDDGVKHSLHYTEQAQEVFNRWNDYFLEQIDNAKVKGGVR